VEPAIKAVIDFIDGHPVDSHVWDALARRLLPLERGPGWEVLEARLDARWPDRLREWPQEWWAMPTPPDAIALVRSAGHYPLSHSPEALAARSSFIHALATHHPPLTRLAISGDWSAGEQEALFESLPSCLRKLMLWVDTLCLDELSALPPSLTALDLEPGEWTDDVATLLTTAPLEHVSSLTLRFDTSRANRHLRLAQQLAASGFTPRLEALTLVYTSGAPAWEALSALPWPRLRRLRGVYCRAQDAALAGLVAAMPALEVVDWFTDGPRPAALRALPEPGEEQDPLDW
jgi:hypothetical protein